DVAVLAGPGPWETPVVPADHYRRLAADLRANGATVVADLRGEPLSCALAGGVTVLKISHEELLADGRVENDGEDDLFEAMAGLRREGADHVVVTRAGDPALALIDDEPLAIDPPALEVVDHRGAGDSLSAGLRLGAAAAGLNVTRRGLATGDRREIDRLADHIKLHPRHDGARRPA